MTDSEAQASGLALGLAIQRAQELPARLSLKTYHGSLYVYAQRRAGLRPAGKPHHRSIPLTEWPRLPELLNEVLDAVEADPCGPSK